MPHVLWVLPELAPAETSGIPETAQAAHQRAFRQENKGTCQSSSFREAATPEEADACQVSRAARPAALPSDASASMSEDAMTRHFLCLRQRQSQEIKVWRSDLRSKSLTEVSLVPQETAFFAVLTLVWLLCLISSLNGRLGR